MNYRERGSSRRRRSARLPAYYGEDSGDVGGAAV